MNLKNNSAIQKCSIVILLFSFMTLVISMKAYENYMEESWIENTKFFNDKKSEDPIDIAIDYLDSGLSTVREILKNKMVCLHEKTLKYFNENKQMEFTDYQHEEFIAIKALSLIFSKDQRIEIRKEGYIKVLRDYVEENSIVEFTKSILESKDNYTSLMTSLDELENAISNRLENMTNFEKSELSEQNLLVYEDIVNEIKKLRLENTKPQSAAEKQINLNNNI